MDKAYADKARAGVVGDALSAADRAVAEARRMPDYPARCRRHHFSGVVLRDKLGVANKKADIALGNANQQTDACAVWYDVTKAAREPK
ncbi:MULTISPECIES: hypothetical protein [unclassified Mesorhizobium]|uniref:hypothetical protein n=1 Tax=unclassified Mesorhizobium TaxID=325217 RepID=UPI0003CE33F4|nr:MULTISPECIES: hypothetical protein [unclassified Mesorhizobium]ESY48997.1 hypothetical protein X745_27870 [Mesorhizobium sp. LNJC374B00]ESY52765.1 hypothetical protein X744_28730 [Mesorhizobium sp. LNJC372A00]WJI81487.1 hypothetical protein NLY34_01620 [Mesorhizobium sp. C374B]WJI88006.1 hypothetical protein NLY42_04035 [Mesorhizobium sp. C372A]